jgi:hypothetical protein
MPRREPTLRAEVGSRAANALGVNHARLERLEQLERVLAAAAKRCVPVSRWDCVVALMTPEERERMKLVSRVLGVAQVREWLGRQRRWLEEAMPRLPWAGRREPAAGPEPAFLEDADTSRRQRGWDWLIAQCERQVRRLNEEVTASDFWEDLRVAGGQPPVVLPGGIIDSFQREAEKAVEGLAVAMDTWDTKVQHECGGLSPRLVGTLGMTILAGVAILVAVPGPVAALTPVIAAAALKAGLLKLGAAGAFGAVSGRPLARLAEIVREKLLASPEFNRVREAAENMRRLIEEHGQAVADRLSRRAGDLVLKEGDPLRQALEVLSRKEGRSA